MITNAILPPLTELINPAFLISKFFREKEFKKGLECVKTQEQLNKMYEDPEFDLTQRYAIVLNTLFTTAFYAPVLPVGICWAIIAIFFTYWVYLWI